MALLRSCAIPAGKNRDRSFNGLFPDILRPDPRTSGAMAIMACKTFDSPFGPMHVISNGKALIALGWGTGKDTAPDPVVEEAVRQLAEYFAGTRRDFDLPLAPGGTPHRAKVWEAMKGIPFGRVATYGDVARAIGSGPRAVGAACGANPLPIVIPCHRVVAAGGLGGGYSGFGGLTTKTWLLDHEQKHAQH